jgi:hypothetical protein
LIPTAREPDASGLVVEVDEDMVGLYWVYAKP